MMILALGADWLAYGARSATRSRLDNANPGGADRLSGLSRYSSLQQPCTVAWHPEQSSIGVASFEGDPRHATTLLERRLRAQGEISSDVKILILESQQVGRGYQVLYVTVALDEWQQMLSWAGSQQHICRLTLATALAFKRVQAERAVVLHAGRHFHFFARHDGQLVHLQAVSVDDNVADLGAVAAMLAEMEMSMVLVIIGVVMGAVMVGTDVLRSAKGQQAFSVFVAGWRDSFSQHVQVVGRVPGDGGPIPANIINSVVGGGPLCNNPPNSALSDAFLAASLRIPQGRGSGSEDRFVYQDSDGTPHELQVCFVTLPAVSTAAATPTEQGWSVQNGAVGTFAAVQRHVMVITGLTAELAMQMDVLIDGNLSARFGQFRRGGFAHVTNANEAPWTLPNETVTTEVTALFEMF